MNRIVNKCIEKFGAGANTTNTCDFVLLDTENCVVNNEVNSQHQRKVIYEHKGNYLLLHYANEDNEGDAEGNVEKIHRIINSLLYDSLLEDLCRLKYRELCNGEQLGAVEPPNRLFDALKQVRKELSAKLDNEEKSAFIEHILGGGTTTVVDCSLSERILREQLELLALLYKQVEFYSKEYHEVTAALKCFQMAYVKRMGIVLNEEFERRKRSSQQNIEQETRKGDALGDEIEKHKREMNEMRRTMQRTEKELTARLKEIEQNKSKLSTLKESLDKQDTDLEAELVKLKDECALKEKEYKAELG